MTRTPTDQDATIYRFPTPGSDSLPPPLKPLRPIDESQPLPRSVKALGWLGGVALVVAVGAGLLERAKTDDQPKDPRIEAAQQNEQLLLQELLSSGKAEVALGEYKLTTFKGPVTVSQLGPLTPNKSNVITPINLRSTPDFIQKDPMEGGSKDNIETTVGRKRLAGEEQLTSLSFDGGFAVTAPDGGLMIGGYMPDKDGNLPKFKDAADAASHIVWFSASRVMEDGSASGVEVSGLQELQANGGMGTEGAKLVDGHIVGAESQAALGAITVQQ